MGTVAWQGPEKNLQSGILNSKGVKFESKDNVKFKEGMDIFNIGIIACELFTNCYPFQLVKIKYFAAEQDINLDNSASYSQKFAQKKLDKWNRLGLRSKDMGIHLTQAMLLTTIFGYEEVQDYYKKMDYVFRVPEQFFNWLNEGKTSKFEQLIGYGEINSSGVVQDIAELVKGCLDLNPVARLRAHELVDRVEQIERKIETKLVIVTPKKKGMELNCK